MGVVALEKLAQYLEDSGDPTCCTDCGRKVEGDHNNPESSFTFVFHGFAFGDSGGSFQVELLYAYLCMDCVNDFHAGDLDRVKWFDASTGERAYISNSDKENEDAAQQESIEEGPDGVERGV
jgi:hypothetical protein